MLKQCLLLLDLLLLSSKTIALLLVVQLSLQCSCDKQIWILVLNHRNHLLYLLFKIEIGVVCFVVAIVNEVKVEGFFVLRIIKLWSFQCLLNLINIILITVVIFEVLTWWITKSLVRFITFTRLAHIPPKSNRWFDLLGVPVLLLFCILNLVLELICFILILWYF